MNRASDTAEGYGVYTSDSFMDEQDQSRLRTYATFEEARAAAERIVARELRACYREGMTADEWVEQYQDFGDDPWIRPCPTDANGRPIFSAWAYAEKLVAEWIVNR